MILKPWYVTVVGLLVMDLSVNLNDQCFGFTNAAKFHSETPQFAGPIQNVTVALGREAVLSCTVTNLENYKVGWMKADDQTILALHTRVITHNPRITVDHDDKLKIWQLRIRQLKESDRGCYMCQINTGEMKKQIGCIDVHVPPDIDDNGTSGDVSVREGENVTLTCRASGHPEPRILWRREDGGHLMVQDASHEIEKVETFRGPVLKLVRVDSRQMGAYLCIASNDVPPAVSKRITLQVNYPPKVLVQKPLLGAPLSTNVKLKCDVEAYPNSHNYWMRSEQTIFKSEKYTIQERKTGQKTVMLLTVHNISKADIGAYTCIAQNTMGKSEDSIRLYEIKPTTTSTTTTTTSTTTTTTTETNLILEIASSARTTTSPIVAERNTEDDSRLNWLFPSVAPAPLELETYPNSKAGLGFSQVSQQSVTILTIVFIVLR